MGLVDYSDSETSEVEEAKVSKASATTSKPAFQKIIDRSQPGKIKVTLPGTAAATTNGDEPPAKRVKTSGGGLGGFNSFLPAPKRTGVAASNGLGGGSAAGGGGLAAGVSLKTGAQPGFSRELPDSADIDSETTGPTNRGLNLPAPKTAVESTPIPADEVKLVGKPMMFKPLSVSRNPAKKKKQAVKADDKTTPTSKSDVTTAETIGAPKPRPKVSLFSVPQDTTETYEPSNGEYKPMIHGIKDDGDESRTEEDLNNYQYNEYTSNTSQSHQTNTAQSLTDIASDLGLSESDKRQLFGRQRGNKTAQKVINFNTDQEYQHNNELRAQGETATHNPVRSIAPGKHSIKQLLNAAQSQKEALEESFAKGKSTRNEAASRYGW